MTEEEFNNAIIEEEYNKECEALLLNDDSIVG